MGRKAHASNRPAWRARRSRSRRISRSSRARTRRSSDPPAAGTGSRIPTTPSVWSSSWLTPLGVKAIAAAKVKTDKVDSDTLALLRRADLIPAWSPSPLVPCAAQYARSSLRLGVRGGALEVAMRRGRSARGHLFRVVGTISETGSEPGVQPRAREGPKGCPWPGSGFPFAKRAE